MLKKLLNAVTKFQSKHGCEPDVILMHPDVYAQLPGDAWSRLYNFRIIRDPEVSPQILWVCSDDHWAEALKTHLEELC